jgi:CRISPR-associated endonuclease Csn1
VPILKVRVKESIGRAEKLKDNVNQWVNPRNNHHVLIYKDEKGNLKEDVVTFWTVVERKRTGQSVYQLPIEGKEIVTSLHTNDMFIIGLKDDEINWETIDFNLLSYYLYRVQKTSKKEKSFEFNFRSAIASSLDNKNQEISIQSFKKWIELNPIKVKISVSGKIEKL